MKVWSAHGDEQRELESRPVGGSLPQSPAALCRAGGQQRRRHQAGLLPRPHPGLVHRPLHRHRPRGHRQGVLANRAPSSGLPTYVTDRLDKPPYATHRGDNRLLVSYYATAGAKLTKVTVDGHTALMTPGVERGHPVYTLDVELPAGSSRTVMLHLLEPRSDRAPTVLNQQLPRLLQATVHPPSECHGDSAGPDRGRSR